MPITDALARDVEITTPDGLRLHARHWSRAEPRGMVVVAHGFGEHLGWYDHVVEAIGPAAEVDFVAVDLRGHGSSPGRRGVVGRYDELTDDLIASFDWAGRQRPGLPRFILGHSNGGQLALRAALDPHAGPRINGLIVSNPSIQLALRVPGYKLGLARLLLRYAPRVTLHAPLEVQKLTRDPLMQERRRVDGLAHNRISAPFYFGMVEGGRLIAGRAREIVQPTLMILGGSDPIIDPAASRAVFDLLGTADKTLQLFPPMRHEPFNEIGRESVFAEVVAWLGRRLPRTAGR